MRKDSRIGPAAHWDKCINNGVVADHAESWLRTDTVDYWRHQRMYAALDPLLQADKSAAWLTVGDGRFGRDAHYIQDMNGRATASDISASLLKVGKERGYIEDYSVENLESLSFPDGNFDYVFGKECLHHLPRPWLGLYEMLRVSRRGIALVEPFEAPLLQNPKALAKTLALYFLRKHVAPLRRRLRPRGGVRGYGNHFEDVGNYKFKFSERELEKTAIGFGCRMNAYRFLNSTYWKGLETAQLGGDDHAEAGKRIKRMDDLCDLGASQHSPSLVVCLMFHETPGPEVQDALKKDRYRLVALPENPHAASDDHGSEN